MTLRRESSSMVTATPFSLPTMPPPASSIGYPNGCQDDSAPGPSHPSPSQRFLSHMLPSTFHPTEPPNLQVPATFSSTTASTLSTATAHHVSATGRSLNTTPLKSSLRLSHPPPAPSSSYLQHITPQLKRTRLIHHDSASAAAATSPLSQSSGAFDASSAPTGPLSSPSMPNVRPLSGILRPLPAPPTPSPSQRLSHSNSRSGPLISMPHRSIEDLDKLLPRRQPAVTRPFNANVPQRGLLQAIPPQPPLPVPLHQVQTAQHLGPLIPAVETLPIRTGWSLTGFRSFDLDLERIADVVALEQARLSDCPAFTDDTSRVTLHNVPQIKRPHLGPPDRGLPSGSVLEVLGPPGSGKSSLILQFGITERLRALGRARDLLMVHDDDIDSSKEPEVGTSEMRSDEKTSFADSCYFSEDFWDAEVASADQVLLVDCEGALTPENIADAAWSAVISLWSSTQEQQQVTAGASTSFAQSADQERSAMPEEVRRLLAAVLAGIHVSRVTSLAGLVALLHSLRPTNEFQDGQAKRALPLPPRTSLILIDSLSYHLRSSGGSNQDRKASVQASERIREMLLSLQKPFEYRPQMDLSIEEQQAARQRCREATAKLCTPTIVFTNQLGIGRGRNDLEASGRASPSGRSAMGMGSDWAFNKPSARGEGSSSLVPLLNGQRPPQSARERYERPAPSVALCGPEMWEGDEQTAASPRRLQDLTSRNTQTRQMGHNRGWPPSFLGQDVWRMLLFRHGTFGRRYAQMVSVPPAVQSELSGLWAQTRQRMRARPASTTNHARQTTIADPTGAEQSTLQEAPGMEQNDQQHTDVSASASEEPSEEERDTQMLELLGQLRASLFRWRPFHITSRGLES